MGPTRSEDERRQAGSDPADVGARPEAQPGSDPGGASAGDTVEGSEVDALRAQVADLRSRVEMAEAEAEARERATVTDPEPPAPVTPTALNSLWLDADRVEPEPPRRHWWRAPTPPPTTLDSFWLTDEPVGTSHRPWWRGGRRNGRTRTSWWARIRRRSDQGG